MANVQNYDYIVVGLGGIGSAAVYWLARNAPGKKILGIEQFELGHVNGGSQDYSRIIRRLYHEEKFANVTDASYQAWAEVETESGLKLVHETGGLVWTVPNSGTEFVIDNYADAMEKCGLKREVLTGRDIMNRWPQFTIPENSKGVFDPQAGLVDAAMGNAVHQQLAESRGARLIERTRVHLVADNGDGIKVHTDKGIFKCKKVIIASGAWINQVLSGLGVHIPVKVSQEQVSYFATPNLRDFTKERFPITIYSDKHYDIYTLPIHGLVGCKAGLDAAGPPVSGDSRDFKVDSERVKIVEGFIKSHTPKAMGRIMETRVCLYTMTYDRTFVIDTLGRYGHPDAIVCCGAGHAYKFAAVFGRILSELAVFGQTNHAIEPFTINRPAITDPNYKPTFAVSEALAETIKAKI